MNFLGQVKRIPSRIVSRAKYDDLLYTLLQIGLISLAVSAPALAPVAIFINAIQSREKKYLTHKIKNSYYYFQKRGFIRIVSLQGRTRIELTKEGERRARYRAVGKLLYGNVATENKWWDGKWRIAIFDLKNEKNRERNAIRLTLKHCGFILLQKSVWAYPYDCLQEIVFLRTFFGLNEKEFRLVVSDNIGDDNYLRRHYKLPFSSV